MRPDPAFTRRLLLALAFAAPLAACGRKGDPEAPEGADEKYPRQYPAAPRRQ
jgi:predicted small lipoprotein YifL